MKKLLAAALCALCLLGAALAEDGAQTRVREITVEGTTEAAIEVRHEDASGYVIWLPEGWTRLAGEEEDSTGLFVPEDSEDVSLTVVPAGPLTAEEADSLLAETAYADNDDVQVSEASALELDNGTPCRMVEAREDGLVWRYYLVEGDGMALCVTCAFPAEAEEGYGARMEAMVKGIEFAG